MIMIEPVKSNKNMILLEDSCQTSDRERRDAANRLIDSEKCLNILLEKSKKPELRFSLWFHDAFQGDLYIRGLNIGISI